MSMRQQSESTKTLNIIQPQTEIDIVFNNGKVIKGIGLMIAVKIHMNTKISLSSSK